MLHFRILGPLEALADGRPIRLGGPRQRATLAILLLNANRVVPVERLAEDLYAGRPPVTAVTQVQRQVSELRRALGSTEAIATRAPGYLVRVQDDGFDLARFERLVTSAGRARADPESTGALLREALDLWRGPPLADLAYEPFALAAIERLEELRLVALEERIDADLELGRHAALVAELEQLAGAHPLREGFHRQLVLALYRSGRQAEALERYRDTRRALVEGYGLEPSAPLQALERAILTQDPSLDIGPVPAPGRARTLVVAPSANDRIDTLLELASPLGAGVVLARLVAREEELPTAADAVNARRSVARTAAFTSGEPAADIVDLATGNDAELVLLDAPPVLDGPQLPASLAELLRRCPAHVGVLAGTRVDLARPVFVPFGGGEHDWAALELAASLATAVRVPLRLVGARADRRTGRRDASRLLADAALAVQSIVDVDVAPVLTEPSELAAAVRDAGLVAVGMSPRWRQEGIGEARRALVSEARSAVLLVHRGPRPGVLAPRESRPRFTWTVEAPYVQAVSSAPT